MVGVLTALLTIAKADVEVLLRAHSTPTAVSQRERSYLYLSSGCCRVVFYALCWLMRIDFLGRECGWSAI
jgi:hypothetical protein